MNTVRANQAQRVKFQRECLDSGIWTSCLNCMWRKGDACDKFKANPPVEVVVVGCSEWDFDIPF